MNIIKTEQDRARKELYEKFFSKEADWSDYGIETFEKVLNSVVDSLITHTAHAVVEEVKKRIEEQMFQIREKGTGETWEAHKELSDLLSTLTQSNQKEQ